jgi:uncharacterized protein YjiK
MVKFPTRKIIMLAAALSVTPRIPRAQSVAELLSEYEKTFQTAIEGTSVGATSGVTFSPVTGTLFAINDRADYIFEISTSGELIRQIRLSGFTDTEGIAWKSGNLFYISDEREAEVVKVELPESGSGPVDRGSGTGLKVADNMANEGLEGVAYHAATNTIYSVKEKSPVAFYRITCDENGDPVEFFENDPFAIQGINGDAAGVYALDDGNFLILSQEDNRLYGFNEEGEILSDIAMDMRQPEGVTFDPETNSIYVIGEPNQLAKFETDATSAHRLPACPSPHGRFDLRLTGAGTVTVDYSVPSAGRACIELVSPAGKRVRTLFGGRCSAGNHHLALKLTGVSPGVYGIALRTGRRALYRSMVVQ